MKLMCIYIYIFNYIYIIYIYILTSTDVTTGLLGSAQKYSIHILFRCKINGLTTASLDKAKLQACLQNTTGNVKIRKPKTLKQWTTGPIDLEELWFRDSPNMTSWFQINYIEPLDISLFKHLSGYSSCVRIIAPNDFSASRSHQESSNFTLSIPAIRCLWWPVKSWCQIQQNRQDGLWLLLQNFDCYLLWYCIFLSIDFQSLLLLQSLLVKSFTFIVNEYHRCLIRLCSWCALSNMVCDEGPSDKNILTHHKTLQILQRNHVWNLQEYIAKLVYRINKPSRNTPSLGSNPPDRSDIATCTRVPRRCWPVFSTWPLFHWLSCWPPNLGPDKWGIWEAQTWGPAVDNVDHIVNFKVKHFKPVQLQNCLAWKARSRRGIFSTIFLGGAQEGSLRV